MSKQNKTAHTSEPWRIKERMTIAPVDCSGQIVACNFSVAACCTELEAEANAARIVACVNALAGLNPAAVKEAVAALEYVRNAVEAPHFDADRKYRMRDKAVAALAALQQFQEDFDESRAGVGDGE